MTALSGSNGLNGRTVPVANGKASYAEKHNIADHFIGGNRLAKAPSSKVKDFVAQHDGHTVITNVSGPYLESAMRENTHEPLRLGYRHMRIVWTGEAAHVPCGDALARNRPQPKQMALRSLLTFSSLSHRY